MEFHHTGVVSETQLWRSRVIAAGSRPECACAHETYAQLPRAEQLRASRPYRTSSAAPATASKPNPWSPDHAVFNATKDELKAMPEFKYSTE
jgi:hypothetical protein